MAGVGLGRDGQRKDWLFSVHNLVPGLLVLDLGPLAQGDRAPRGRSLHSLNCAPQESGRASAGSGVTSVGMLITEGLSGIKGVSCPNRQL